MYPAIMPLHESLLTYATPISRAYSFNRVIILLKGLFSLNFVNFLAIESISVASFLEANILLILGFADSDLEGVGGRGGGQSLGS